MVIYNYNTKPHMIPRDQVQEITGFQPDELERVASAKGWVDICKGWNGELSISG